MVSYIHQIRAIDTLNPIATKKNRVHIEKQFHMEQINFLGQVECELKIQFYLLNNLYMLAIFVYLNGQMRRKWKKIPIKNSTNRMENPSGLEIIRR